MNASEDDQKKFASLQPCCLSCPLLPCPPVLSALRSSVAPCCALLRDAAFHVMITSYQLLVGDEKYLRRVKWQYLVLDEAQAIKSAGR